VGGVCIVGGCLHLNIDGAEEPKEADFWMAQRSALKLDNVGFATTTDIERALHPPDKQDVASRLLLEIRRVVYGEAVVSRGPEVLSTKVADGHLAITFSNSSLAVHEVSVVSCTRIFVRAIVHFVYGVWPLV
jgi:hypothetical protein